MGVDRNSYKFLVGKPERRRPLRKSRRLWEDTKTDFKEIGWKSVDWIHWTQDKDHWLGLLKKVMNLLIP
jgi:hypothetical protein